MTTKQPIKRPPGRPRKQRKKPGPKLKLDDKNTRSLIESAFALDCTDEEACFYAKISTDTLARYKKKNPDFAERIRALTNTPVLGARQTMVTATKNDPKWAGWYLERKKKDEFSLRTELTGADGQEFKPIQILTTKGIEPSKPATKGRKAAK